jgi:hypothetical protein
MTRYGVAREEMVGEGRGREERRSERERERERARERERDEERGRRIMGERARGNEAGRGGGRERGREGEREGRREIATLCAYMERCTRTEERTQGLTYTYLETHTPYRTHLHNLLDNLHTLQNTA